MIIINFPSIVNKDIKKIQTKLIKLKIYTKTIILRQKLILFPIQNIK